MGYESFGPNVLALPELEWQRVTAPGQDGESWIVREKGGNGYVFRVSLSNSQRNSAPLGTAPIEDDDFPKPDVVMKAIALAIEHEIAAGALDVARKGTEYPVTVTAFHLYEAVDQ